MLPTADVKTRNVAVSMSTRISLSSRDLIDFVVARENITIREVIEQALVARWGDGGVVVNDAEPSSPVDHSLAVA